MKRTEILRLVMETADYGNDSASPIKRLIAVHDLCSKLLGDAEIKAADRIDEQLANRKTEREIRKHRDDLRLVMQKPCNCAAEGHAYECQQGAMYMTIAIRTLDWVLGENEDYERMVEHISAEVRR